MKHLKLFFACMLMAVLSIGQVWATEESVNVTPANALNDGGVDPITIACAKGDGTSNPAISSGQLRLYQAGSGKTTGNTITFSSTYAITKIEFTFANSMTASNGSFSDGTYDSGTSTWSGSTNSLTLTVTGTTSGTRIYITGMTVYYETGGGTQTCATPTFSPAAGSYEGTQNVTISSTAGATIYYTTDGTTPLTSSSVYSSAIPVAADMTIKAFAVKSGLDDSEVATAAYEITEGPDVTINLLDDGWGFPTSKVVDETSYTNGDYTIKVAGTTGNGFRTYGTYFLLGQSGAYIELPEFANPIEKIVVSGNSGGSGTVAWNIFKGDDAVSAAASGCKNDAYTFNIDPVEANAVYRLKVTSAANLQIKTIKIFFGAAPAVAKPTISGDENFVGSTSVSISHADADHIYYTTNGDAPTTSSTEYSDPFELTNTATVKAIAVKGSDVSAVAEKTFTKVEALESMAALLEATTSTETAFNVVISNWVVTGVNGSRAWIADAANTKGILLYKSGHNFVAGNKLNGVVIGTKSKLYQGYPELTSLVSTDVTVTTAETVTPRVTTIAALTSGYPNEQGTVVKLENLTYTASTTSFSDGVNTLALNTQLYNPTMLDGAIYTIIGVVRYDNEAAISIMPRSVDDVEQTGGGGMTEVDGLAALKAEATGTSYLLNLTDAIVTLVDGSNAFIEDATAGALIYKSGHGFSAGDKLNGQYEVTTATYQGKFEITAITATTGTKTTDAEIPVTTLTIAQLNANFAANESKRIKIVGVNVTDAVESGDATARTGEISDGENTITLYAGKSGVTAAENANIDVIGYPTFHNTDQQLAVWAQADITVNEKEDPELAYDPASETIEQGASWSAPTLTNPHSLTISSYASDNESVATVTGEGVIALAGGLGTAVITAHFNGDATYNAGNATYTITVEEADARKKATGSAFEAISGDLTPADITFAAYKGDGTTTPVINSSNIRLYKPASGKSTGSYLTVTAKVGCTIDQVKITFASAATAAYSVDDAELPTEAFITGQTELLTAASLNAQSVSIVNLKNGSIDVSEIKVWYTGTPLAIDHYFLGGTYETTFEQNGTFDYTGLKVYAAYDAGETITEEITGFVVQADLTTAGNKKAEVMLNSVKIAEYDITVTAGKEDPALAYSPVSETITAGDAWSAPTLSNTFSVSPITYSSDKESVATVTSEGVITLAGGYGTAVITAHFDETAAYIESEATYTITVNKPAPTPTSTVYRKVTATADITDGEYLIVYEGDATHDAAVFDGSLDDANIDVAKKALPVAIVSDEIAGNTDLDAAVFTIDVTAGSLQSASGLYIGKADYANGMDKSTTEAYVNTFAITDGEAVIKGAGNCTLRYNYASDQLRFRYYKSGQQAIQLYKKETPEPPTPAYTDIRTGLTAGNYYTICLPKKVTNFRGATIWNLEKRNTANTEVYLEEAELPFEAGTPFIIQATATTLEVVYEGAETSIASTNGALVGTLTGLDVDAFAALGGNIYILKDNAIRPRTTGNWLSANRAYIDYNALDPVSEAPTSMPGKKVRKMPMQPQTPTGLDELNAGNQPMKVMINGQFYILRGEKMYNANGQVVK